LHSPFSQTPSPHWESGVTLCATHVVSASAARVVVGERVDADGNVVAAINLARRTLTVSITALGAPQTLGKRYT
jgi:hypothetical protein